MTERGVIPYVGHEHFVDFNGQHDTRLSIRQDQRLLKERQRTWLIRVFSPLLFCAPDTHLRGMRDVWVDGAVQHEAWMSFVAGVQREWEGLVLYVRCFSTLVRISKYSLQQARSRWRLVWDPS